MTKTISFVLEGQRLRLSSDAPVQYSDEIAVEIGLDADYAQATDVALITQPEGRNAKPARSVLTINGRMAQGTIKRKQLMQDGTVLFVLAGKIGDAVLPTAACYVQVQRSADPQAESYVDDPETIVDVISKVVAENGGLPSTGYDDDTDFGNIAVVNKGGKLNVQPVEFAIDDNGNLVLRGTKDQVVASIPKSKISTPIALDSTLTVKDEAADAKATGDAIGELKEDLDDYYPKKQGAFKCVNIVSNLPDEVIMPAGIEKKIVNNMCVLDGTSTIDYPNFIIKKSILADRIYLFAVDLKENENTYQTCSLIARIGAKAITRMELEGYPLQLFEYKNYSEYTTFCALFSHESDADVDFSISFDLTKTGKKMNLSAKDIVIADVTGLSDAQIKELVKARLAENGTYYNPGKNVADDLVDNAKESLVDKIVQKMSPDPNGFWYKKKCLVLGDSTSATEQWQKKLAQKLGMSVTTHAKGGIGFLQMVVGSLGYEGDYDNETGNTGVLQPLKVSDVYDKDLIIIFGGFNNRGTKLGEIDDLYKTDGTGQNTVTGQLQFVLNWVYDLLKGNETYAQNLKCKIALVTPYCCGKYNYANYDGYSGDSWAGYTLREMCDRIVEVATLNNCSSYNAWKNSGIGRHTWTIYSASPTATKDAVGDAAPYPTNADQLHLNDAVGYPHLGDCIAAFLSGIA